MNMKQIKNIRSGMILKGCISICCLVLLAGCSKFDQDFTRNPIDALTIEGEKTNYTVIQLEQLQIPIKLSFGKKNEASYTYAWKAIADDSVYVISREKDLDIKVKLPPKNYNLEYTVTDKESKLEHSKMFSLTVTGLYYEGWFVTHNQGGKGKLSFVRSDNRLFDKPAEDINERTFSGKGVATFYSDVSGYGRYTSIHYFTETEVFRFDPSSFLLTGTTKNVFLNETKFVKPAYGTNQMGADQYFINNGDVHAGMGMFNPKEILLPFTEGFGGDYDLFPIVISSMDNGVYFYDNKYKRFLQTPYLERDLYPVAGSKKDAFDLSNVGKKMIAADKGRVSSSTAVFYFIMEDQEGRYLYGIDGNKASLYQKMDDTKCPEIRQAASFATSSVFQHLYYAVDNKIYLYNIVANTAELLYSFPSSTKISQIKIKRKTSKTLAVATSNGSAGEFHIFEIDDLGHFKNDAPSNTLKGFGDIVHIEVR